MIQITHKRITNVLFLVVTLLVLWLSLSFYLVTARVGDIFIPALSQNLSYKVETTTDTRLNKFGEKIEIRTAQSQIPSTEIFLYLHGNAGPMPSTVEGLSQFGTVISPAYPGFAGSSGIPTPDRLYDSVDVAMKYLLELGFDQSQITVVGHSLGGSAALYAGISYPKLKKIILVSTYYSIQSMCQINYYIFCILTGDVLNNSKLAPAMKVKVRQFHHPKDQTVPFKQGRDLFNLIGASDKKFTDLQTVKDGDYHNGFTLAKILAN